MTEQGSVRFRRQAARALKVASMAADLASQRVTPPEAAATSLQGDRWVEWSFCFARMADGPGTTLDFGADIGFLSLAAAQRGHEVVALDRMPSALDYEHPSVTHVQGDVLDRPLGGRRFDQILNCSSVEHVGLSGRYGSDENPEGDLQAMAILRDALADGGRMILTIPVGGDAVFSPLHRIYGPERLPRLLDGYAVAEEQFWTKEGAHWVRGPRERALAVTGTEAFYALGLFVLTRGDSSQ
jgi:SAM-dependent methyltransferase